MEIQTNVNINIQTNQAVPCECNVLRTVSYQISRDGDEEYFNARSRISDLQPKCVRRIIDDIGRFYPDGVSQRFTGPFCFSVRRSNRILTPSFRWTSDRNYSDNRKVNWRFPATLMMEGRVHGLASLTGLWCFGRDPIEKDGVSF